MRKEKHVVNATIVFVLCMTFCACLLFRSAGTVDATCNEASERKVATMTITKEEVMAALDAGRVTCNLKGNVASFGPQKARDFLVKNLDQILDPESRVDLSFERKYSDLLATH